MLRKYNAKMILVLIFTGLGLSACGSKETDLNGKYNYVYEDGIYYNFVDGTNYTTNNLRNGWNINDSGTGTYIIDGNKIITSINDDEYHTYEVGYIYRNYIGSWWEGELPNKNDKTKEITIKLLDIDTLNYQFKEDDTYEFTIVSGLSDNEVVFTEVGVYEIKGDIITCTNENNQVTTFLNSRDGIFCIEYIKE